MNVSFRAPRSHRGVGGKCKVLHDSNSRRLRNGLTTHVQRSHPFTGTWTITDGNAGNLRQAQALAAALGRPARDIMLHARAPSRWGGPRRAPLAVQILDPRIAPRHWDLVIAPGHDELHGGNVIRLLGSLHPVDDQWLDAARRRFAALAALPRPRTALLLGGASAHARFPEGWTQTLATRLQRVVSAE